MEYKQVKDSDFKPEEIISGAVEHMMTQHRKQLESKVSNLFLKADSLSMQIHKAEQEANKARKKLDKVIVRIERLKSGDWSVLNDTKEEEKTDKE